MKQSNKSPAVTLVGAGPGAADLITIRGLEVLQRANIILYDALVSQELLEKIDPSIPLKYVGKRCGKHSRTQDEINGIIVTCAFEYGHVVRLKGGDPFVFGRASEEIAHVESFGIPVTVVPGISSALAVPAGQGIPVTKRGSSSSFWVMTATRKDGSFSEDLVLASRSTATLVILMGVRRFLEIARKISDYRGKMTPIAIIQNGTVTGESCVTGTLGQAAQMALDIDLSKHGVIVVGDVVAEHPSFFEDELQRVLSL
ncbi:MAG: uroporphyrinogen-III C-methyltransferase [Bacteroidota bacterium]